MIDFTSGFQTSIYISVVPISLVVLGFLFSVLLDVFKLSKEPIWYLFAIEFLLIGFAVFLIVYPALNIIGNLKIFKEVSVLKSNIDFFTLRFVSMLLGVRIMNEILREFKEVWGKMKKSGKSSFIIVEDNAHSTFHIGQFKHWFFLTQFGLYAMPIIVLFYLQYIESKSWLPFVLNIIIFFVIDDWTIIQKYVKHFDGKILRYHYWFIEILNVIISIITIILIFLHCKWYIWILTYFIYICIIVWRTHSLTLIKAPSK